MDVFKKKSMTRLAIWMYFKKNQNGIDAIGNDVLKKMRRLAMC